MRCVARCSIILPLLVATACGPSGSRASDEPSAPSPDVVTVEDIRALEQRARALARTEGCTDPAACDAAPLGAKACGGPRTYIAYCATTTDTSALFATLDSLREAERRYNEREGIISDCMLVTEPPTEIVGTTCRIVEATPGGTP